MAGKGDEAERAAAVAQWLDGALGRLMQLTDEAIAVVAAAEPPADVAEAEKRGRAIGVLARTAKAVAALEADMIRKSRSPEEDGMSDDHRDLSDAELAGLQAEFFARVDHLVAAIERKSLAAGLDREPAARAEGAGAAGGGQGDAEAERRPDRAA